MKFLITSDLHLTDAPRDKTRFGLFPWLRQQQNTLKTDALICLGDLVDAKDRHSSILVNAVVDSFRLLKPPIFILKGNHDYIDPGNPFFRFLNAIPGVRFFIKPEYIEEFNLFMVPNMPDQAALNTAFKMAPEGCIVACHNTFTGAASDVGGTLSGLTLPANKAKAIYSGDVHVPQVLNCPTGDVIYIGSPYQTRAGKDYECRVLLLDGKWMVDLHFDAPKKLSLTVRDVSELSGLSKGDQVKITLELPRSEMVEWQNHKQAIAQYCIDRGIEVFGTELKVPPPVKRAKLDDYESSSKKSNLDYFKSFCTTEQLPTNIKKVGMNIIEGSNETMASC